MSKKGKGPRPTRVFKNNGARNYKDQGRVEGQLWGYLRSHSLSEISFDLERLGANAEECREIRAQESKSEGMFMALELLAAMAKQGCNLDKVLH